MIYNDPFEREVITYPYVWQDNIFSEQELKTIIDYCDSKGTQEATTFAGLQPELRKSEIKFHQRNAHNGWIFDRLNLLIEMMNEKYYRFDLNGYNYFQYTKYNKSGKYGWHMDTHLGSKNKEQTRKLSLSIQLNDEYTGGDFMINEGEEKKPSIIPMQKGRAVLFPSFLIHRVAPITKGVRKSLVVWVQGPKFR
jgi:PKHD-type hydroxylase